MFLYRSKVGDRLCGQKCKVKTPRLSLLKELFQHLYTLREYYRVQCCLSYSTKSTSVQMSLLFLLLFRILR